MGRCVDQLVSLALPDTSPPRPSAADAYPLEFLAASGVEELQTLSPSAFSTGKQRQQRQWAVGAAVAARNQPCAASCCKSQLCLPLLSPQSSSAVV